MKRVSLLVGIILGACTLITSIVAVNDYFAKAAELELVSMRLDQKIAQDRCDWIQQRIWQIEDRYRGQQMPQSVIEEYRKLIAEYDRNCK